MPYTDVEVELHTLKVMAENMVAYFYPQDSNTAPRAPELLDMLLTQSREIIISNMRKASVTSQNFKFWNVAKIP
jgi:hypothetical protein